MVLARALRRAKRFRDERARKARRARPFGPGAERRLLLITLPDRIPQSQIFPFHFYAPALRARHGIDISEVHLADVLSGSELPAGATDIAFQSEYDFDEPEFAALRARVGGTSPGARLTYLDWFAPTDLRMAERFGQHLHTYVKKNLLRDRGQYGQETFGDTNLMAYYGRRFGLSHEARRFDLPPGFAGKLRLGPSFVTADFILPRLAGAALPDGPRPIDLHARIAVDGTPWYAAMRAECLTAAEAMTGLSTVTGTGIRHDAFLRELQQSKLCFSPFGYGEVCWRDFEAIMNGAVLLKQNMAHLETLPDVFRPDETYVPLRWDLEDFEGVVRALLADPERQRRIARSAFEALQEFATSEAFVRWAGGVFGPEAAR